MKNHMIIIGLGLVLLAGGSFANDEVVFMDSFEGDDICDPDINEPDTEVSAYFLGEISDCDMTELAPGVLGTPADADWYRYTGIEGIECTVNPGVSISSSTGRRSCIYIECHSGAGSFSCPEGSTDDISPGGRKGCCTNNTSININNLNCPGIDESADVWLRVDQSAQDCNDYSASVNF